MMDDLNKQVIPPSRDMVKTFRLKIKRNRQRLKCVGSNGLRALLKYGTRS